MSSTLKSGSGLAPRRKILVVDPSRLCRLMIKQFLEERGQAVVLCDNIEDGRNILALGGVEAVVTSIMWPGPEEGRIWIQFVETMFPDVQVLVMTSSVEEAQAMLDGHPVPIVQKPVGSDAMVDAMSYLCPEARPRVLFVDDEESMRAYYLTLMKNQGIEALAADGLDTARQLMEEQGPDLIVCDLRLRRESGIDLLDFVKHNHPGLPFILITAYPDPEAFVRAHRLGVYDLLIKPIHNREFVQTIRAALSRPAGLPGPSRR